MMSMHVLLSVYLIGSITKICFVELKLLCSNKFRAAYNTLNLFFIQNNLKASHTYHFYKISTDKKDRYDYFKSLN